MFKVLCTVHCAGNYSNNSGFEKKSGVKDTFHGIYKQIEFCSVVVEMDQL